MTGTGTSTGLDEDESFFASYEAEQAALAPSLAPHELEVTDSQPASAEQRAHSARFRRPVAWIVAALSLLALVALGKRGSEHGLVAHSGSAFVASTQLVPAPAATTARETAAHDPAAPEPIAAAPEPIAASSSNRFVSGVAALTLSRPLPKRARQLSRGMPAAYSGHSDGVRSTGTPSPLPAPRPAVVPAAASNPPAATSVAASSIGRFPDVQR